MKKYIFMAIFAMFFATVAALITTGNSVANGLRTKGEAAMKLRQCLEDGASDCDDSETK